MSTFFASIHGTCVQKLPERVVDVCRRVADVGRCLKVYDVELVAKALDMGRHYDI